jgi:hypothetical protein
MQNGEDIVMLACSKRSNVNSDGQTEMVSFRSAYEGSMHIAESAELRSGRQYTKDTHFSIYNARSKIH